MEHVGARGTRIGDALREYYQRNGFDADGGRSRKFEVLWLFKLVPIVIPNIGARREAIRFHDVHHMITDYQTDWAGEFEIAWFELGGGCGKFWFAWWINLAGAPAALLWPSRCFTAWRRGRRSRTLYCDPTREAVFEQSLAQARDRVASSIERPSVGERMLFATVLLVGTLVGAATYLGPVMVVAVLAHAAASSVAN